MVSASGDALEWALALAKAPSERVALRQRSLPAQGMEQLLKIASGTALDAVTDAARRTNQEEGDVVEAARFYAREILFHQGADAYRVLGLQRDATPVQIKTHYRLLQQWLHPDRHTSDWDAIFAARVNAAWHHLRSHEHRSAYDVANPVRNSGDASLALASAPWVHQSELEQGYDRATRWRRRAPVIALFGICALLGILALLDSREDPERWQEQVVDIESGIPALVLGKRANQPTKVSEPERRESARRVLSPRVDAPQVEQAISATGPKASDRLVRGSREPIASTPEPAPAPILPQRAPTRDVAAASSIARVMASAPVKQEPDTAEPPRTSVATPPRIAVPANGTRIAVSAGGQPSATPAKSPVNSPTEAPSVSKPVEVSPIASGKQVQMAQQVGDRLVKYMRGSGGATPPIWGSLVAQRGAAKLRDGLRAAGGQNISAPSWRVGSSRASMRAEISYPDGQAGRLAATLEWREQGWWVSALSMERDL